MRLSKKIFMSMTLFTAAMLFGLTACSTMNLKEHPEASNPMFLHSESKNGISVVAQPLLDNGLNVDYFGVNLPEVGILATHLTIRNDNPDESFMVLADSVRITQITGENMVSDPAQGDRQSGEGLGVFSAVLISPLLMAVAVQQLSDASIIEENFEKKKLRSKTIDPGEEIAGFSYFDWEKVKMVKTPQICLNLVNPVQDVTFPYCLKIATKR